MATWPAGAGGPTNPYSGKPSSTSKSVSKKDDDEVSTFVSRSGTVSFQNGQVITASMMNQMMNQMAQQITYGSSATSVAPSAASMRNAGYPFNVTPQIDFDQRPFLMGSLIGTRCFRLDNYGRLQPVNDFPNSTWTPGENLATCHRQYQIDQYVGGSWSAYLHDDDGNPIDVRKYKIPEHEIATAGCWCGFYAYYDNLDNPHYQQGYLYGLIEGYGVMTVGTRGFRCSKAQIKALVIPAKRSMAWTKVAANYSPIPVFETESEALKKFPLSLPSDIPNPENTDDFWTRKA